jgi:hypothetical protein
VGIIYGNKDEPYPIFKALTDSDWAQGKSRKSICGYVIDMGGGAITWSSKQQDIVALSSCKAKYIASTHAAKEVLWLRSLAQELGFTQRHPTPVYSASQNPFNVWYFSLPCFIPQEIKSQKSRKYL